MVEQQDEINKDWKLNTLLLALRDLDDLERILENELQNIPDASIDRAMQRINDVARTRYRVRRYIQHIQEDDTSVDRATYGGAGTVSLTATEEKLRDLMIQDRGYSEKMATETALFVMRGEAAFGTIFEVREDTNVMANGQEIDLEQLERVLREQTTGSGDAGATTEAVHDPRERFIGQSGDLTIIPADDT